MIEVVRLQHFRNIENASIELGERLNVFTGENGSGKTSLLEAVYVLSRAKSFRAANLNPTVNQGADGFTIFAQCMDSASGAITTTQRVGFAFDRKAGKSAKLNGESIKNVSKLARQLPVTYFGPESLQLLAGSPEERRGFLDWGLFHVEHRFLPLAQRYGRALKQRNAALKQKLPISQITVWDGEMSEVGEALSLLRQAHIESLWPRFEASLVQMSPNLPWLTSMSWNYKRGWADGLSLAGVLSEGLAGDMQSGFTRHGPHRADWILLGGGKALREHASAGQSKVVVCALLHAQARLIEAATKQCPVSLMDDLPAELDEMHRATVLTTLAELKTQFLVTATERSLLHLELLGAKDRMFHVKRGSVQPQTC